MQLDDPSFKLLLDCIVRWDAAMAEAKRRAERRASNEWGVGAGGDYRQGLNRFRAQERGWAVEDLTLRCMQGKERRVMCIAPCMRLGLNFFQTICVTPLASSLSRWLKLLASRL